MNKKNSHKENLNIVQDFVDIVNKNDNTNAHTNTHTDTNANNATLTRRVRLD